jgi:uncharacterized spore protein YtfJ
MNVKRTILEENYKEIVEVLKEDAEKIKSMCEKDRNKGTNEDSEAT